VSRFKSIVVGLCVAVSAALVVSGSSGPGPHLAAAGCEACHLGGTNVEAAQAFKLVASQETLCVKCHPRALEFSHPSGFAPKRALPVDYPLDWKGEMTCSTCHLAHGQERGLLRGKLRAKAFCLACHDAGFFNNMKDAGTSIVISGHLDVGRRGGNASLDIDTHSLHCLGCHVGGQSEGGSVSMGRNGVVRHSSGAAPHPIGRSYRDASKRGGLHPEGQLAQKKVVLSEGRISCISCHEAYKKDHGKLVASLERSALCLSCHAK
jgi:predicted CXXCH cytochrome family protein